MRLHFANRHQKDAWDANAKYSSIGTWKLQIEGYLENLSEKEKSSISIEIKAFQNGGESATLAAVLPNNVMSCSTNDIEACEMAFEQALQYAGSFGSQLTDDSHYNVLSYTTSSFSEAGIYKLVPPNSDLEPINKIYLDQLDSLFEQQLDDRSRSIEMLGEYSKFLNNEWLDELETIKRKTDQNAYVISKVADICYQYPYNEVCSIQYGSLINNPNKLIKDYDRNFLYLPAPTISLSSSHNGDQTFSGIQGQFGDNAPVYELQLDSQLVIGGGINLPLDIVMTNTNICKVYLNESSTSEHSLEFSESGTYDLSLLYDQALQNYLFSADKLTFDIKLTCKGLGGDITITFPMKANLPTAKLKITTGNESNEYSGNKNQYIPNEKKYSINFNTLPIVKQNEANNILFELEHTKQCSLYVNDISPVSPRLTFTSSKTLDISSLLNNQLYNRLLLENRKSFDISIVCEGIGGDVGTSWLIYAHISKPKDSDGDGLTDLDEINIYGTDPLKADTDNDGLSDKEELPDCFDPEDEGYCHPSAHISTDPLDYDSDNDGLNDYDDQFTYPTNPNKSDTDSDGLSDYKEVITYRTNPSIKDTDKDGYTDGFEVNNGTNPLVADVRKLSANDDNYDPDIQDNSCQNYYFTYHPLKNDSGSNLQITNAYASYSKVELVRVNSDKQSIFVKTDYCHFNITYTITNGSETDIAKIYVDITPD